MTRNFKDIKRDVAPEFQQRAARDYTDEMTAYHVSLGQLRRALQLTQTQLAQALEVSQAQVSRIERQTDLFLSTLRSYIEAMGGRLELTAIFGDAEIPLDLSEQAPSIQVEGSETQPDLMEALEAALAAAKAAHAAAASGERVHRRGAETSTA